MLHTWSDNIPIARACANSIASLLATAPPPHLGTVAPAVYTLPGLINHSDAIVVRAGCSAIAGTLGICLHERVEVRRPGASGATCSGRVVWPSRTQSSLRTRVWLVTPPCLMHAPHRVVSEVSGCSGAGSGGPPRRSAGSPRPDGVCACGAGDSPRLTVDECRVSEPVSRSLPRLLHAWAF